MKNNLDRAGIAIFLMLTLLPLGLGLAYAALYSFGLAGILQSGFTTSHWQTALGSSEVFRSMAFSIYVASVATALAVPAGLLLAILLRSEFNRGKITTIFYFPLAIPPIVAAFLAFQLFSRSGLFSRIAVHFHLITGIDQFPDLVQDRLGIGIILTHTGMAIPFFAILFANLFAAENVAELKRVARSLGATWSQAESRIAVPLLLRRAFPAIVLYWIYVLGSYEIPLMLGRQSPQMISVLTILKLQRFNLMDIPVAFVIAFLYLTIAGAPLFFLLRKRRLAVDVEA